VSQFLGLDAEFGDSRFTLFLRRAKNLICNVEIWRETVTTETSVSALGTYFAVVSLRSFRRLRKSYHCEYA